MCRTLRSAGDAAGAASAPSTRAPDSGQETVPPRPGNQTELILRSHRGDDQVRDHLVDTGAERYDLRLFLGHDQLATASVAFIATAHALAGSEPTASATRESDMGAGGEAPGQVATCWHED